jgi:hypothetical protein
MPFWSKPKKSKSEKKEYKTLTGSVFMTDEEVADAIKKNAGKPKGTTGKPKIARKDLKGIGSKITGKQSNPEMVKAMRGAMEDIGTVGTFGLLGIPLVGRQQRQRREKAQADRIESLLKDIKNKK